MLKCNYCYEENNTRNFCQLRKLLISYPLVFKTLNKDKYTDKWYGIDDTSKSSFKNHEGIQNTFRITNHQEEPEHTEIQLWD